MVSVRHEVFNSGCGVFVRFSRLEGTATAAKGEWTNSAYLAANYTEGSPPVFRATNPDAGATARKSALHGPRLITSRETGLIQQLNQRRTRNVQHVRCQLGSEFGVDRNRRRSIAARHFLKDAPTTTARPVQVSYGLLKWNINYGNA